MFAIPLESLAASLLRTSESMVAAFLTLASSELRLDTTCRPSLRNATSSAKEEFGGWLALERRAPSVLMISWTTKCSSVVFPSAPLTSASLRSVSSLKACASPRSVPTFMRFPVLSTASRSFKNILLVRSSSQAAYRSSTIKKLPMSVVGDGTSHCFRCHCCSVAAGGGGGGGGGGASGVVIPGIAHCFLGGGTGISQCFLCEALLATDADSVELKLLLKLNPLSVSGDESRDGDNGTEDKPEGREKAEDNGDDAINFALPLEETLDSLGGDVNGNADAIAVAVSTSFVSEILSCDDDDLDFLLALEELEILDEANDATSLVFKTLSNDADRDKDFLLPLEPLETLADADDEEEFLLPLETLEFLGDAASYVSETLFCGDEEDESKFAIRVFSSRALLGGNESGESKGDSVTALP
ncbi:hypothetical protein Ahy_A04g017913 isoform B [Arachis hypogaea]|uniref:Uncharacterized protein n=1 Tax=Arachis hypogaea TaxID=3818 RepID=A0A445DCH6_ARAHY|nr:hypothetical protein Ahy_A04g017913 isoform B [Arachis hypogaea]